ncbi:hypothetical protein EUGRSUZ_G03206 [Eucalyptus grandis]|uniref:BRCT domain-containing protein n=5 Tax=Eucalyptus grandis TaxID=71139 RepID=A0A059BIJ8_EUCGR|nr:hypothetical protein EUGRSUZ_G03206 [Eucalyptus grandis]KAK3422813.1 hypothetical protein EUGRSUZ_G03206 [Eucalyptus grandis]KAK3422814.1 hypothetical protein EUGRSUZ_G03206 [Eucalyptus grandis]KAK3422815.1 hypothetical protein EUGRSUZ_G03206 [Eucalyptus grandis]
MASLGFRYPQFSEDLVWLPDWLQQNQSEFPAEQPYENAALFRENVGEERWSGLSSEDEGGYAGCRLFLSGEDGSPFLSGGEDGSPGSYAQSPGKVLHFHLRFSYNSGSQSQCMKSQESNASLAGIQSSKSTQIQRVENASQPVEKVRGSVHGENLRRHLKDADLDAAVELSIAASEAMAIHELVENDSALKSLPAAAVVEVALWVKEARLKGSEEVSNSVIKRTEEDIDLDDIAMLDAFKDVGLSFIDCNERGMSDFDISQVKETPSSQIHCENGSQREETRIDFNKMNAQEVSVLDKQPESDSLLEYSQYECRKSTFGDKDQGSPTFDVASHVDTMLHQSALKESFVLTVEKVGSGMVENALCERQEESFVNISQCTGNTGEYRQVYLTEERFQSRWLGGWSAKDLEPPVELKEKSMRTRSIAKFFVHETSFLSESADIAPDENSVVQIGISTQEASQLKMACEGSCDKDNEGISFSQEIVKSSSLSSADPLCSFVPCSISAENDGLHHEPSQNCIDIDGEKFNDPDSELGLATKDAAALQVHLPGKRKLPLISDDRNWRHNMDSQQLAGDFFRKSNVKRVTLPLNAANIRQCKKTRIPGRKRVSFSSEIDFQLEQPLIFHNMGFLLTGFSTSKEKEIEKLIQKHGGEVLLDIPPVNLRRKGSSKVLSKQRTFVISPRKLKTAKFLYGCAIRAFVLKVTWITESISAGSLMLPDKYMIISNQADAMFIHIGKSLPPSNSRSIFGQVGIMLHGKKSFCNKFSEVIKHGGGAAYRTLQRLVHSLHNGKVSMGIIVTEYESRPSRHLRQCALERKIPIMTMSWIIESLYAGKLLSVLEQNQT